MGEIKSSQHKDELISHKNPLRKFLRFILRNAFPIIGVTFCLAALGILVAKTAVYDFLVNIYNILSSSTETVEKPQELGEINLFNLFNSFKNLWFSTFLGIGIMIFAIFWAKKKDSFLPKFLFFLGIISTFASIFAVTVLKKITQWEIFAQVTEIETFSLIFISATVSLYGCYILTQRFSAIIAAMGILTTFMTTCLGIGWAIYAVSLGFLTIFYAQIVFVAIKKEWKFIFRISFFILVFIFYRWWIKRIWNATELYLVENVIFATFFQIISLVKIIFENINSKEVKISDYVFYVFSQIVFYGFVFGGFYKTQDFAALSFYSLLAALFYLATSIFSFKKFQTNVNLSFLLGIIGFLCLSLSITFLLSEYKLLAFAICISIFLFLISTLFENLYIRYISALFSIFSIFWFFYIFGNYALSIYRNIELETFDKNSLLLASGLILLIPLSHFVFSKFETQHYILFDISKRNYRKFNLFLFTILFYFAGLIFTTYFFDNKNFTYLQGLMSYTYLYLIFFYLIAVNNWFEKYFLILAIFGCLIMIIIYAIYTAYFYILMRYWIFNSNVSISNFVFHYIQLILQIYLWNIIRQVVISRASKQVATQTFYYIYTAVFFFLISYFEINHIRLFDYLNEVKNTFYFRKIAYFLIPIAWGIVAFAFLLAGIIRDNIILRALSIFMVFISLLKFFLFDWIELTTSSQIILLIFWGILLNLFSFIYIRFRKKFKT